MSQKDWEYVSYQWNHRKRKGKESNIEFNNCPLPRKKIQRELARRFPPTLKKKEDESRSPQTPPNLVVFTLQSVDNEVVHLSSDLRNLPWTQFCSEIDFSDLFSSNSSSLSLISQIRTFAQVLNSLDTGFKGRLGNKSFYPRRLSEVFSTKSLQKPLPDWPSGYELDKNRLLQLNKQAETANSMLRHAIYLISNALYFSVEGTCRNPADEACHNTLFDSMERIFSIEAFVSSSLHNQMTCRALMPPLLRWAVRRGNLEAAKVALRTIGKSRAQRHNSSLLLRPLYSACYSGNIQVVQLLLEYAPEAGKFANSHNYYGLTRHLTPSLLCTTIKMGFVEIAKLILQSGASVSYRPPNIRKLPIHEAAQHGYSGLMEILLEADATIVDQPDFCGKSALRIATENGHTNVIKVLMSFGAQHQYFSRFFFDCQSDMELHTWLNTRPLINHLYEGFECSHSKISPLQWAARNEDLGQMQLLLDRGANIDDPSPLPIAIQEECWTSVRFLVTSGANIKTKGQPGLAAAIDRAIQYGDRKYLDYLTINGAKIDPSADYVANAFMEAASVGDLEMVQYLLNLKVDVNISVGAKTALLEAIRGCHLDVTKYLLGQNAEIDLIYSNHPWSAALGAALTWNEDLSVQDTPSYDDWSEKIHNNRLKILELLFEYGARFDELDAREYTRTKRILIPKTPGEPERSLVFEEDDRSDEVTQGPCSRYLKVSPFVRAVASGVEISILEDLIERGADVNTPVTRTNVSTALQAASMHRSVDVVRFLLAAGADVNANPNSYFDARLPFGGRTALQAAASASDTTLDHLTKVRILVREHANVNAPAASIGGVTALQGAAIVGNIEMVRYLLDHGADVNAPKAEVNGRTALEGAADLGRLDIVQLLLNAGADSHVALEWRYVTALKYAEVNNYIAIEELLQKQRFKDLKEAKVFNNDATEVSSEQNQTVLGGLDDVSGVDLSGEGVDVNPMPTEMQPFVELPVPAGLSDSLDQTQEYEAMSPAYEEWMRIFEPNGLGDLSVEHDLGFDRT